MRLLTVFAFFLLMTFSLTAEELAPRAEIKGYGGNYSIVVTGFDDLGAYESYECKVDFGTWVYSINAEKTGENEYSCMDSGYMSRGAEYRVDFVHYQWPDETEKPITSFYLEVN